jgi:cytochrome P450
VVTLYSYLLKLNDLEFLWAMNVNANVLAYWLLIYILSTPTLLPKILSEIAPHANITKPESIGRFSEAPNLSISHEGLAKNCPLFKSTYFEALRISSQPWSIRRVASDVAISRGKTSEVSEMYKLNKGEYLTIPHELHMRDPSYFPEPEKFIPERFLVHNEDGSVSAEQGTIRPFGGGPSMCKGRVFAERECLALVAGVLMYWDIEPTGQKWVVPEMVKTSGVSRPKGDTKVRVRRKKFEWD